MPRGAGAGSKAFFARIGRQFRFPIHLSCYETLAYAAKHFTRGLAPCFSMRRFPILCRL